MTDVNPKIVRAIRDKANLTRQTSGLTDGQQGDHSRPPEASQRHAQKPGDDWHGDEEERLIDGRPDVNYPALLTKDVPGG